MLYEQIGINLLRDSSMQIQDRRFRIITKEELQPGDLIFGENLLRRFSM